MNYFMGIALCVATVSAEAIPDTLSLSPVQDFLYQRAFSTFDALKNEPEPTPLVTPIAPNVPDVVPQIPAKPEVTPLEPKVPDRVPQVPAKPEVTPLEPKVPDRVPQIPAKPLVKPVVPVITSPEVEAAKARAIALYGKEPGFAGVTNRIVRTRDGQRFLYINIKPDGNCGFYASAVDRPTFVATTKDLVNEQHDAFKIFVNDRIALGPDIQGLMLSSDMTAIAARVQAIDRLADNGGDLAPALKLLTDFETEKKEYHNRLFLEARNSLIKNLQDLEHLPTVRAQIGSLIGVLASASVDGVDVKKLKKDHDALIASLTQAKLEAKQFQSTFKELMAVCGYGDLELFEKCKLQLVNKIQNLTILSSYEAFLTALRQELRASGVSAADFDDKEKLLKSVESVFSKNRGVGTWIPGGLLAPIAKRLGIEYNIWAKDGLDFIQLFSGSGRSGVPAKGHNVRNVFFTGCHYDMLIQMDE